MRIRTVFRWVAWLLLLAVSAFTLSPAELRPVTSAPVDWERFIAFAAIGIAFCVGYPRHRIGVMFLLVASVGLLELLQNVVPGRHGRVADGLFKGSGAFLGAAVVVLVEHAIKRAKDMPWGS